MRKGDWYSEKEANLMVRLGYANLLDVIDDGHFNMIDLIRIAVKDCFEADVRGRDVDSLRRISKAINDVRCYRGTPEYEALIHES